MTELKVTLKFDQRSASDLLAALSDTAERFLEFRDGLLSLIESGVELFCVDRDALAASVAGELLIGLRPSDRLASLMAASGAWDSEGLVVKHSKSPVESTDENTTTEAAQ